MQIDHIGIVVKSIEEGIKHWGQVFGYRQYTQIVENTRQKVNVVFLYKKESLLVKLIEPVDDNSPIWRYAKTGGGLHHLCFKTGDLHEELDRLNSLGIRTIAPPQPGEAFGNENIAFVYAKQGLNVELIETEVKANILKHVENEDENRPV